MFRLLLLNSLGLGANTPEHTRNLDQENLLVYSLKGSPRRFVHAYLQKQLGSGDVWLVQDGTDFAVIQLTFLGYQITGTHDNEGHFTCSKAEELIQGVNSFCRMAG